MFSNVPQGRGMWEQPSGPFEAARYKFRSYSVDLFLSIVKSMVKKELSSKKSQECRSTTARELLGKIVFLLK